MIKRQITAVRPGMIVLALTLFLASCADFTRPGDPFIVEEQPVPSSSVVEPKYEAWIPENYVSRASRPKPAVLELLNQSDQLVMQQELEPAADKLERLLRIDPAYAPAWSRLSWIALNRGFPERARQMAQRSNSYANNYKPLVILNWSFIRLASMQLDDTEEVLRAERMIDSLGGV